MSDRYDGVSSLRRIDIPFNWSDGSYAVTFRNLSGKQMWLARAAVVQGTTAGSSTAGVFTLTLPTADYVITTPATFPVGGVAAMDAVGDEIIPIDGTVLGTVTTASGSAKDATLQLHYWGA